MWPRFLAVFTACLIGDRHCDPPVPIDTIVDPRSSCQTDAFGNFVAQVATNNSVTVVEFQYQIETTHNNTLLLSDTAIQQVELALSNVLVNAFFDCRRRRNLQKRSMESLMTGISAFPVDRVYPGVPCALETDAPGCFTLDGAFTIYGEGDLTWGKVVAYTVTENAMMEGTLNNVSSEIQSVRYIGDGALLTAVPTLTPPIIISLAPTVASNPIPTMTPTLTLITQAPSTVPTQSVFPSPSPTTLSTSVSPTTTASPTQAPVTEGPISIAPTIPVNQIIEDTSERRILPWWYIAAAGGSILLVVSGGSLLYAKRQQQRRRQSNDSDQIGGFPQPNMV